jgi:hypothetical protein
MGLITRREFIDKLKSIALVAPIAPALIEAMEATVSAPTSYSVAPSECPQLTMAMLMEAYMICTYGNQEPDLILMAPDTYAEFMASWVKLPDAARYILADNEVSLPYFNGAAVTFSKGLPRRTWLNINSQHPEQPRYSGYFEAGKLSWRPIPKEFANA